MIKSFAKRMGQLEILEGGSAAQGVSMFLGGTTISDPKTWKGFSAEKFYKKWKRFLVYKGGSGDVKYFETEKWEKGWAIFYGEVGERVGYFETEKWDSTSLFIHGSSFSVFSIYP